MTGKKARLHMRGLINSGKKNRGVWAPDVFMRLEIMCAKNEKSRGEKVKSLKEKEWVMM